MTGPSPKDEVGGIIRMKTLLGEGGKELNAPNTCQLGGGLLAIHK